MPLNCGNSEVLSSDGLRSRGYQKVSTQNGFLIELLDSSDKKIEMSGGFPKSEECSRDTRRDSRDNFLLIQSASFVVLGNLLFIEKFGMFIKI
ncbi:MAG: hypothetical protein ACW991_09455 [Candidatus Hodarchaeales archaeon]|jgi:hypothetical protein